MVLANVREVALVPKVEPTLALTCPLLHCGETRRRALTSHARDDGGEGLPYSSGWSQRHLLPKIAENQGLPTFNVRPIYTSSLK